MEGVVPASTEVETQAPSITEAPIIEEPTKPAEPTQLPEQTEPPKEAACIKIGLSMASGEANSLDTINVPASEQAVILNQVYEQLMELDSDFVVHPQLSESRSLMKTPLSGHSTFTRVSNFPMGRS